MPDQLFPVLDQVGAAGVQEADLRVGVHRGQAGEGPVQFGDVAAVQPVGGVRQQQIAGALQHRLHPPAQPVPGVERAPVPGALLAEAVPVPEHPQQRGRRVDAQRMQPEPAVGHARVDPHRGPELLLGLRIRAHGVGVHAPQPGEVGRGLGALGAEVHHVPHKPCPRPRAGRPSPVGSQKVNRCTADRSCKVREAASAGRTEGIVPAGGVTSVGCRARRARGGKGASRGPVTQGDRHMPLSGRKARRGQNEAPDHGGTTGGFVSAGDSGEPHIENVRPVRALGQAELGCCGNLSGTALHEFTTLLAVPHPE